MIASASELVSAIVSLASLVWAITTQVRSSSLRRYAQRAETAANMLTTLQEIDLGGTDPRLELPTARALHEAQIRGLQEVVRVNAAAFESAAKRVGFPLYFHFFIGIYGALFFAVAASTLSGIGRVEAAQQWIAITACVGLFGLSGGMVLDFVIAASRRIKNRLIRRRAGMFVPTVGESLRDAYQGLLAYRAKTAIKRDAAMTSATNLESKLVEPSA
jgi:hypothetical protein